MSAPSSPLQLEKYLIEALSFKTNPSYDVAKTGKGVLKIDPDLLFRDEGDRRVLLKLRVRYRPSPDDSMAVPYQVDVLGEAFFSLSASELSVEEEQRLALFNGSAILYGLLRGYVAQATALAPNGPLILPVANLVPTLTRRLRYQMAAASAEE